MRSRADHYKEERKKAERVRPRFKGTACGAQVTADGNLELHLPTNTNPATVVSVIVLEKTVLELAKFMLATFNEPAAAGVLPPGRKPSTGPTRQG